MIVAHKLKESGINDQDQILPFVLQAASTEINTVQSSSRDAATVKLNLATILVFLISNFHSVPIKPDSTNYVLRHTQIQNALKDIVDGSLMCPAQETESFDEIIVSNPDRQLWKMRNRQGIDTLDIGYIRDIFPETYFDDQSVLAFGSDIKIKKLMPLVAELQRHIDWMEKVPFSYSNSDSHKVSMSINCAGNKKHGGTFKCKSVTEIAPIQMMVVMAYLYDFFSFQGRGAPSTRPYLMAGPESERVSPDFPVLVTKHKDNRFFEIFHPRTAITARLALQNGRGAVIRGYSYTGWLLLSANEHNVVNEVVNQEDDGNQLSQVTLYNLNTGEFRPLPLLVLGEETQGLFRDPSLTLMVELRDRILHIYKHKSGEAVWEEEMVQTVGEGNLVDDLLFGYAFGSNRVIWFDSNRNIHAYCLSDGVYLHAPFSDDLDGMNGQEIRGSSILFEEAETYILVIGHDEVKIYRLTMEDAIVTVRMASMGSRSFYGVNLGFGYSFTAEGIWGEGKIFLAGDNRPLRTHCRQYDTLGEAPSVPHIIAQCSPAQVCNCKSAWVKLTTQ